MTGVIGREDDEPLRQLHGAIDFSRNGSAVPVPDKLKKQVSFEVYAPTLISLPVGEGLKTNRERRPT
jgi:hypothetical protein